MVFQNIGRSMYPVASEGQSKKNAKQVYDPFPNPLFCFFLGEGMGGFFFRSPPMKSEVPEVSFTNACLSHSSQE